MGKRESLVYLGFQSVPFGMLKEQILGATPKFMRQDKDKFINVNDLTIK